MDAVVQYALWLLRQAQAAGLERPEMPEVLRTLDHHLDPRVEPSLAVRSVYGQYFPWLLLIDNAWSQENAARIFSEDPEARLLRDAAWCSYLRYCAPYDEAFDVLRAVYSRAVDEPPVWPEGQTEVEHGDVYGRLGEHLLTLHWRGVISLKPEDLVVRYWASAPDPYRAHAVHMAGFAAG